MVKQGVFRKIKKLQTETLQNKQPSKEFSKEGCLFCKYCKFEI